MAFDDRDTSIPRAGNELSSVERIIFKRNRSLSGVQLELITISHVDGVQVAKKVPADIVDAAWPGGSKTLKNHLLSIIDNAVEEEE